MKEKYIIKVPKKILDVVIKKDIVDIFSDFITLKQIYNTGTIKKNIAMLARDLKLSRPTIYLKLEKLIECGFIRISQNNKYYIIVSYKELFKRYWISDWKSKYKLDYQKNNNIPLNIYLYGIYLYDKYDTIKNSNQQFCTSNIEKLLYITPNRTNLVLEKLCDCKMFFKKRCLINVTEGKFSNQAKFYHDLQKKFFIKINEYKLNDEIRENI